MSARRTAGRFLRSNLSTRVLPPAQPRFCSRCRSLCSSTKRWETASFESTTRRGAASSMLSRTRLVRPDKTGDYRNIALAAAAFGTCAGLGFVTIFDWLLWGSEHDEIDFRVRADKYQTPREGERVVYGSASGVPQGVIGDIWKAINSNVVILEEESEPIQRMLAQLRDQRCAGENFVFYANRLWMLLLEQALCEIDDVIEDKLIVTPNGHLYRGNFLHQSTKLCGISVQTGLVEANRVALNSLLSSLQELLQTEGCDLSRFGEIIVEKHDQGASKQPLATVSHSELPGDIQERYALVVHPTLSTGTSVRVAVEHLVNQKHVPQNRIFVLILVACPESIEIMNSSFPEVTIVCAALDSHLDENKRIVPGLGDFGARYAHEETGVKESEFSVPTLSVTGSARPGKNRRETGKLKRRKTRRSLANKRKS